MKILNTVFVFLAALVCCSSVYAGTQFLADRHVQRGVDCLSCHSNATDGKMKLDKNRHEACVTCHGWYDVVVQKTVPKDPEDMNPHSQHDGNLPCSECHKGHKQSVNYCQSCHMWTFKVP